MASAAVMTIDRQAVSRLRRAPRSIRVLTVDGHQLVQEALAVTINSEEDMTVVASASNGQEAIDDVRRYRPDVVTLDLLLPDMAGEDLARRILAAFPDTRIVAITSAQGHMPARRALDAGVHGYLSKAASSSELVEAIRRVQAGGRMIPGPVAVQAPERVAEETRPVSSRLSDLVQWFGALWRRLMHNAPMWPIHGNYRCRTCSRSYPVLWAGEPWQ